MEETIAQSAQKWDKEKGFSICIEDKYQRSYINYNGIDNITFQYGGKGPKGGGLFLTIPDEEHAEILDEAKTLIEIANSTPRRNQFEGYAEYGVSVGREKFGGDQFQSFDDEEYETEKYGKIVPYHVALAVEGHIFKNHPEFANKHDEVVQAIKEQEREKQDIEAQQKLYNEKKKSALEGLKNKYPNLFDEDGTLSLKAILTLTMYEQEHELPKEPQEPQEPQGPRM